MDILSLFNKPFWDASHFIWMLAFTCGISLSWQDDQADSDDSSQTSTYGCSSTAVNLKVNFDIGGQDLLLKEGWIGNIIALNKCWHLKTHPHTCSDVCVLKVQGSWPNNLGWAKLE